MGIRANEIPIDFNYLALPNRVVHDANSFGIIARFVENAVLFRRILPLL